MEKLFDRKVFGVIFSFLWKITTLVGLTTSVFPGGVFVCYIELESIYSYGVRIDRFYLTDKLRALPYSTTSSIFRVPNSIFRFWSITHKPNHRGIHRCIHMCLFASIIYVYTRVWVNMCDVYSPIMIMRAQLHKPSIGHVWHFAVKAIKANVIGWDKLVEKFVRSASIPQPYKPPHERAIYIIRSTHTTK